MRIIGGEWKGRRLFAPEGMDTRPTSDKVREALFSIIQAHIEDARVIDLFAGSGALSLEALSRGAAFAAMIDSSRKACAAIRRNIELCDAGEYCKLFACEWQAALPLLRGEPFSLVFLDPPYRLTKAYREATDRLLSESLLCEDALIVMEHAREAELPELNASLEVYGVRRYGDTCLSLVRRRSEEA